MAQTRSLSVSRPGPPRYQAPPPSLLPAALAHVARRAPRLARPIRFGWRLAERWTFDRCSLVAAAMAFFGLLSLFPMMIAATALLFSYLADSHTLRVTFLHLVNSLFPGKSIDSLHDQLFAIRNSRHAATVGFFSLVWLLWSGRAYFYTLANVLNNIWPDSPPRNFFQQQFVLLCMFLGAGGLFLLSAGMTIWLEAVHSLSYLMPDLIVNRKPILWTALGEFTSWLLAATMFWLIYRYLPNAPFSQRGRAALGPALVASCGWELAKFIFTQYISKAGRYGAIYGGVAGVVLTLLWLYISSLVILLGAEAAVAYQESAIAAGEDAAGRHAGAVRAAPSLGWPAPTDP